MSVGVGAFRGVIVINVLRHLQPSISSRYQTRLAISTPLFRAHPILPVVALFRANVGEAVVENFLGSTLAGDECVFGFHAFLRRENCPEDFLAGHCCNEFKVVSQIVEVSNFIKRAKRFERRNIFEVNKFYFSFI